MCKLCYLALADDDEEPEFHALPVHPDYVLGAAPKSGEGTCASREESGVAVCVDDGTDASALKGLLRA